MLNGQGQLVEYDGLKQGPQVIEEGCSDVLKAAVKEIMRRLEAGEISDSLSVMTLNAL